MDVQQTPQLFNLLTVAENLFLENPLVQKKFGMVSHSLMLLALVWLVLDLGILGLYILVYWM